jgi:SAM-dependent methyltransferase
MLSCPVCGARMQGSGREYGIAEIFDLWRPVVFSPDTIAEHVRQAPATRLYRCGACGLERFSPPVIGTSAFYVEAYNLRETQPHSTFTYSTDKWEFDQALRDARACRRVFEFGCAEGEFLGRLRALGIDAAGTEYNAAALEKARAKGLKVYDTAALPAAEQGSWDGVFSFHVLEHAAEPVAFARAMADMAAPGGLVVFCVPNQDGPIRFIEPCAMNMPPHHATRWRRSAFEALARRLGLTVERIAYEPLLLENHGYYSVHAVRRLIGGAGPLAGLGRALVSLPLRLVFGTLRRLGLRYLPLLKGQSIYVVMRKTGG